MLVNCTVLSIITGIGSLAQLVEQLAFNQLVVGSNPTRPTIFQTVGDLLPAVFFYLPNHHCFCGQRVAGSGLFSMQLQLWSGGFADQVLQDQCAGA